MILSVLFNILQQLNEKDLVTQSDLIFLREKVLLFIERLNKSLQNSSKRIQKFLSVSISIVIVPDFAFISQGLKYGPVFKALFPKGHH